MQPVSSLFFFIFFFPQTKCAEKVKKLQLKEQQAWRCKFAPNFAAAILKRERVLTANYHHLRVPDAHLRRQGTCFQMYKFIFSKLTVVLQIMQKMGICYAAAKSTLEQQNFSADFCNGKYFCCKRGDLKLWYLRSLLQSLQNLLQTCSFKSERQLCRCTANSVENS